MATKNFLLVLAALSVTYMYWVVWVCKIIFQWFFKHTYMYSRKIRPVIYKSYTIIIISSAGAIMKVDVGSFRLWVGTDKKQGM